VQLIPLDDPDAQDRTRAGAKAARLAAAKAAGLPVLPGAILPAEESATALRAACARISGAGVHAARLSVMAAAQRALAGLPGRVALLGSRLAVRSSSPVEADGRWSGVFASYLDVRPDETPTAAGGVWASALGPRPPTDATPATEATGMEDADRTRPIAVLMQPEIRPLASGTARRDPSGRTVVALTWGPPGPLLSGWADGIEVELTMDGLRQIGGAPDPELATPERVRAVAALAGAVREAIGDEQLEWAEADGRLWLLQAKPGPPPAEAAAPGPPPAGGCHRASAGPPGVAALAGRLHRYAGDAGEHLVLPWLLARDDWSSSGAGRQPQTPPVTAGGAVDAWEAFMAISDRLTSQAWQDAAPEGRRQAAAALADLRAGRPRAALDRLAGTRPVDAAAAVHALGLAGAAGAALVGRGLLRSEQELWAMEPERVGAVLRGGSAPAAATVRTAARRAALRWEPVIGPALLAHGSSTRGTPAAPGIAVGLAVVGEAASAARLPARPVLVVRRPLARLAPLLWEAAGLVSLSGSAQAHLFDVARSLGVPAVVGCPLDRFGQLHGELVAVDGASGVVARDLPAGGVPAR